MDMVAARLRLARIVRARRQKKNLSVRAAAQRAGIDRATWKAVEAGERSIRDYNHAGIERVLDWTPGSIAAVLAGAEPTERELPPMPTLDIAALGAANQRLRMDLERIDRLDAPPSLKLDLYRRMLDLHEQVEAEARQAGTEQPGGEQPGGEQPGGEQPGTESPGTESPGTQPASTRQA